MASKRRGVLSALALATLLSGCSSDGIRCWNERDNISWSNPNGTVVRTCCQKVQGEVMSPASPAGPVTCTPTTEAKELTDAD